MTDDVYDETALDGVDPDEALADPVFAELFAALHEAGCRPAPPAGAALAALLGAGTASRRRRRGRGTTVGLAVVGVLAGGVGAAAATGHLQPAPPAVTRVADRPAGIRVTGEPTEHPTTPTVPTAGPTREATTVPVVADDTDSAATQPGDRSGPTHDAPPATRKTSSDEGDDGDGGHDGGSHEGTDQTPAPQESGDDHSGETDHHGDGTGRTGDGDGGPGGGDDDGADGVGEDAG